MNYNEKLGDLFEQTDRLLAHCISSDYVMGAGIAVVFNKKGVKNYLLENHEQKWEGKGYCIITPIPDSNGQRVANLITKEKVWHRPTNESVREALEDMKRQIKPDEKIAIPYIGCGIDGLGWKDVSKIVYDTFKDTDCDILVNYRSEREKLPNFMDKDEENLYQNRISAGERPAYKRRKEGRESR